jgi:two-component system, OmpR family, phosphate regulon sensor histidine kinase PhoR
VTSKVFTKLLGLFLLLLVFQAAAMEFVFRRLVLELHPGRPASFWARALWSGLIALAVALPWQPGLPAASPRAWSACIAFARRIADGDLSARLARTARMSSRPLEAALNQTAERLGESFAEIESRRQELAAMLDSMQEAVVAITPEGLVRWSNAVMQRIAGTQIRVGGRWSTRCAIPRCWLAYARRWSSAKSAFRPRHLAGAGRIFEINAAPMPSGGALVVLHDVTAHRGRGKVPPRLHRQRQPRTAHPAHFHPGLRGDAGRGPHPQKETTREFLGVILKNATRMNRLTEDLLALASVESPDYKLALQPTRASALVAGRHRVAGRHGGRLRRQLQSAGAPDSRSWPIPTP